MVDLVSELRTSSHSQCQPESSFPALWEERMQEVSAEEAVGEGTVVVEADLACTEAAVDHA